MSVERYSQEQILSGIRIFWRERLNCESPFDPDMSFVAQLKAQHMYSNIDFDDVACGLGWLFGLTCSWEEWEFFLGKHIQDDSEWEKTIAPKLTFRALADFIRERLNPISLEPMTLLGKPCLTAGVFRALEKLAKQIKPKINCFAPSTPIRARLRGIRLHCFWSQLRWMIEDQLPPPPHIPFRSWYFLNRLLVKLNVKLGIGLLIALLTKDVKGLLAGAAVTCALFIPVGVLAAFINARMNPLPEGIETFGDLARVLAAIILDQQSEAASCSTP